jgi:hypothetical protein
MENTVKALLLAVAMCAAIPATAKTWSDVGCSQGVVSEPNKGFTYVNQKGEKTVCKVAHWPTKNPVAILKCDNGWEPEMELINADTMRFNGIEMYAVTENGAICD